MRTKILFFQPLVWIILFNGRNLIFQITQNLHLMNKPKESKYASHKIAYILEGAIKEFRGFEAILFVDIGPKYVKNISSRSLKKIYKLRQLKDQQILRFRDLLTFSLSQFVYFLREREEIFFTYFGPQSLGNFLSFMSIKKLL